MRELPATAVDHALHAGARYADARAVVRRAQTVATRNREPDTLADGETEGIGVRVLVGGAWGFACDPRLSPEGAEAAARRAVEFARASAARGGGSLELAPVEPARGEYSTPPGEDPVEVPLDQKLALCLEAEEGLVRPGIAVTSAFVRALRETRAFASSDGADTLQTVWECGAAIDALARGDDGRIQTRSYPSAHGGSSAQAGWEHVRGLALAAEAPRVAEEALALLDADPCPATVTTLVLDSEQTGLQLHESVGHPVELDRIFGTEAAYAGTSWVGPDAPGSLRYGSELMHVVADPTTPGGLGTFGWDDEGVAARREAIVEAGVLTGFLASRESAARLGSGSGGSMRADGWSRMPLVRMTNLHLEPGEGSLDDLLADVDDGILMATNRSWSIDDKRLNFQFGTEIAWEIKRGRRTRLLRDATYTGRTPAFWASLDGVAGREEWRLHGLTNCGKGQPGQHAHVSHGASPTRFRGVQVGPSS
jgi:TldD protein